MPTLTGLPGVSQTNVDACWARSVPSFLRALKAKRAGTFAGDSGAVSVWIDDEENYRCHFGIFRDTVSEGAFSTAAEVRKWLTEWLPKCRPAYDDA